MKLVIIFLNPHNNPKNPENPKNPHKTLKTPGVRVFADLGENQSI
jgi:hypothetical protein